MPPPRSSAKPPASAPKRKLKPHVNEVPPPLGLLQQLEEQKDLLELQNRQLSEAHADLERSRHRFADLYDLAPVGYLTLDDKGCIRELNHSVCELLGRSAEHLTGHPLLPFLAQPDRKILLRHLWLCQRGQHEANVALRVIDKSGCERMMEFITQPAMDPQGRAGWFRCALVDITAQRAVSEALRASEANFRLLADNIGEIFWFMDLNPPRFTYVSPAFEKIWGLPAIELYANHELWGAAIHPDDKAADHVAFHRFTTGNSGTYRMEYRVRNRQGELRWIADRSIVSERKEGVPSHICGIARDITERKEAEATRSRLAAVVESSDDAIITKDLDGLICTWNAGAERIFGYTAAEAVGKPITFLRPPNTEDDEALTLTRLRHGERINHFEAKRMRKDGTIIDISLSISPLIDSSGRITGVSKIARDVTEQKLAEQKFRSLLESAPDAMIIVNQQDAIELVNAQTVKLFGYPSAELIGQPLEMLLPERFHFDESKRLADYAAEPYARMLGQMGELYAVRKDGTEFPAEITLSPLETATGTFVISAVRDISQRKKAEEELRLRYVELTAKTAELERFNRAMVDRELRMIELKKEINTLLSESGHPPRFRSDFNVNPDFNLSPSSTQNSVIL